MFISFDTGVYQLSKESTPPTKVIVGEYEFQKHHIRGWRAVATLTCLCWSFAFVVYF